MPDWILFWSSFETIPLSKYEKKSAQQQADRQTEWQANTKLHAVHLKVAYIMSVRYVTKQNEH